MVGACVNWWVCWLGSRVCSVGSSFDQGVLGGGGVVCVVGFRTLTETRFVNLQEVEHYLPEPVASLVKSLVHNFFPKKVLEWDTMQKCHASRGKVKSPSSGHLPGTGGTGRTLNLRQPNECDKSSLLTPAHPSCPNSGVDGQ